MRQLIKLISCFSYLIFFTACSSTKNIPEGEYLYTGADVKLKSEESVKNKKIYKEELEEAIRPKSNSKLLGMRYRLWIYNAIGEVKKEKGFKHWLKYRVGEPPVMLSAVDPSRTSEALKTILENRGIFMATTEFSVEQENKKAHITYTGHIHPPYKISQYNLLPDTTTLGIRIKESQEDNLIKVGDDYNLNTLEAERARLEEALKGMGYFYFNADHLIFQVDSTIGSRQVNLYLRLKDDLPPEVSKVYSISNVNVYPEFSLTIDSTKYTRDTILRKEILLIGKDFPVKPKVIERSIFVRPGDTYSRTNHNLTLNRLMGLGVYKFVNMRFDDIDSLQQLNSFVFLTPLKRRNTRIELQAISRSNNYAGPGITASFRNRNFLKGAELFLLNFRFHYETQITGNIRGLDSYTFEISPELNVPKLIVPFFNFASPSRFVPITKFKLSYDLLIKPEFYQLNSFRLISGYRWRESLIKDHDFNLINITYIRLARETEEFQFLLNENDFLRRSFEEQFIIGSDYTYTFNNQSVEEKRNHVYFKGMVDVAGHLMHLIQLLVRDTKPTIDTPFTISGLPYSNYSKGEVDGRYYYTIDRRTRLIPRLNIGAGIPYGNSSVLPYIKQFFTGGTTSIRAFHARSVGPGTYIPPDTVSGFFFFERSGDIKIESNLELRYDINEIFKFAVFGDAGNVWLSQEDPDKPGGRFKWNSFYRELAMGTGIGLRIDASFFVLRFDLATPLRKPFLPEGERWVINQVKFSSTSWRRENLLLNIAIGYPF